VSERDLLHASTQLAAYIEQQARTPTARS